jgi:hypothetical protein
VSLSQSLCSYVEAGGQESELTFHANSVLQVAAYTTAAAIEASAGGKLVSKASLTRESRKLSVLVSKQ